MASLHTVLDDLFDALAGRGFDDALVRDKAIDTGPCARRARALAARLNRARDGKPKEPVVVWSPDYSAITKRGPWVYVARGFAEALSDDALAFVLAHEMAHHDLGHLSPPLVVAGLLGESPRMELHADRQAVRTAIAAGFDPRGALEALSDALWDAEPVDAPPWPRTLQGWVDRYRTTHPPLDVRRAALLDLIETS